MEGFILRYYKIMDPCFRRDDKIYFFDDIIYFFIVNLKKHDYNKKNRESDCLAKIF